eukprot:c13042_g1_i1 orf=3-668(-)
MMLKAPLRNYKRFEAAALNRKRTPPPPILRTKSLAAVNAVKDRFHLCVTVSWKPQLQHRFHSIRGIVHENVQLDWLNSFDMQVTEAAYAKLLRVSVSAKDLLLGQRLHLHMIASGHDLTVLLCNLLVQMYGKCGSLDDAMAIFSCMCVRNEFSWTLIMEAYVQQGQFQKAAQLFEDMEKSSAIPDMVTFVIMVSACADEAALDEGKRLHSALVERGHDSEVI